MESVLEVVSATVYSWVLQKPIDHCQHFDLHHDKVFHNRFLLVDFQQLDFV